MRKINPELEYFKNILKNLKSQAPESPGNTRLTIWAVEVVINSFELTDSKEAEEILREMLNHRYRPVKFLVFSTLWQAKNKDKLLDVETEIRLEQFKNNPVNSEICLRADAILKAEKAPFN